MKFYNKIKPYFSLIMLLLVIFMLVNNFVSEHTMIEDSFYRGIEIGKAQASVDCTNVVLKSLETQSLVKLKEK